MLRRRGRSKETPTTPRQRLLLIARALPEGIDTIRDVALKGHTEQDLIEEGRRWRAEEIVLDAADLYTQAWAYFARGRVSGEGRVRGCSRQLISLAARQALALEELVGRQKAQALARTSELEKARVSLQRAFERAVRLRDQGRSVLVRVAGNDAVKRAAIDTAALAAGEEASLPTALMDIARVGRELIRSRASSVQLSVYGLDEAYLRELEEAGTHLDSAGKELDKIMASDGIPQREIHLSAGANIKLMLQVLDAFLSAHELYGDVPMLTPKHHENLLRRISRLPPPPSPMLAAASSKRRTTSAQTESPQGITAGPVRLGQGVFRKR